MGRTETHLQCKKHSLSEDNWCWKRATRSKTEAWGFLVVSKKVWLVYDFEKRYKKFLLDFTILMVTIAALC